MARKPRPLKRDSDSFRDDRLFIIACDDTYAVEQYFGFFKISRIKVHVVPTPLDSNACHALDVLDRLKEIDHTEDDERWLLLDTDHYTQGTHLKNFTSALKEANDADINIALSKPCFELWLLLHHEIDKATAVNLQNAQETEALLRKTLGEYSKRKLKQPHFPLATVKHACRSASLLDENNYELIPQNNTSRVYLLWQAIADKALPSQLPAELFDLFGKS